jgi:hypothetical protein
MAEPDRYYGPLFDKIAARQFWARGEAERSEQSEDGKQAKACFSQSLQHRHIPIHECPNAQTEP